MTSIPRLCTYRAVLLMLAIHMMRLVIVVLILKALVHAHLVSLVSAAIEQAMILPMAAVVVHAVSVVRRRVCPGRAIGGGCVGVLLEDGAGVAYRRAVPMLLEAARVAGVLVREEELAAGIEPVERIGHPCPHRWPCRCGRGSAGSGAG